MSTERARIGMQVTEVMQDLQRRREAGADPAEEGLDQTTETEFDYCEQSPDKVLYGANSAQQLIREHPIKSVLVAVIAGALLGTLWTIRRR